MKRYPKYKSDRALWVTTLIVFAQLGLAGCGEDPPGNSASDLSNIAFTVNALPDTVSDPVLPISGTAPDGIQAWASVNETTPVMVGSALFMSWSGTVTLEEGKNTLLVQPRDAAGNVGLVVGPFEVTLDTSGPTTPTLSTDPPACIGGDTYTLEGNTSPGATVKVNDEEIEAGDDGSFSAEIALEETETVVTLSATNSAGVSSEETTVTLRKGVATPTLEPVLSPTNEVEQVLSGTKAAGTGIYITYEGEDRGSRIVSVNNQETWEATLDLEDGENTFTLDARDRAGTVSCDTVGPTTIVVSDVCPPVVENEGDLISPTNDPEVTLTGTKCAGSGVYLYFEGEAFEDATELEAINDEETFDVSFDLPEEGENIFYLILKNDLDIFGPPAGPYSVTLDTIPPTDPFFSPEPDAQQLSFDINLRGVKEEGSNVCLRRNQEVACAEVVSLSASVGFEFDTQLSTGDNFLCISSMDAAGNTSGETCATVQQGGAAGVEIISPESGSIINAEAVTITAIAVDANGIDSVEICLESDCGAATSSVGDMYERTITPPDTFENGETYTVTASALNGQGVSAGEDTISLLYLIDGILLSSTSPDLVSGRPRVAVDDRGRVHAVWHDECARSAECEVSAEGVVPYDIFHRIFEGGIWSPITVVSQVVGDDDSRNPGVVADGAGNIHVVWEDSGDTNGEAGNDFDILYRWLDTTTDTWSAVEIVDPDDPDARVDQNADIAAGVDGSIHIVWQRQQGGEDIDVLHRAHTSGVWTSVRALSVQPGNMRSENPAVAVDGQGVAYVVWQESGDIFGDAVTSPDIVLRTIDGDVAADAVLVTDNALDGQSRLPDIIVGNNDTAHIVWEDTTNFGNSGVDLDIVYRSYSIEDGLGFYSIATTGAMDGGSQEVSIAHDSRSDQFYIAWVEEGDLDGGGADPDIYVSRFVGAFTTPIRVTTDVYTDVSEWPDVVFDPQTSTLHCVWEDATNTSNDGMMRDVFYRAITFD